MEARFRLKAIPSVIMGSGASILETARDTAGQAVSCGLPDGRTRQRFRL